MASRTIEIYTDGGCRPNPGRGACAFIAVDKQEILHEFVHVVEMAKNGMMELLGAIAALKWVKANASDHIVYLHTDSQYLQKGISVWLDTWKKNDWKGSDKKPVKNKEMWMQIDSLKTKNITTQWVRSHNGNVWNDYVDNLCTQALLKAKENETPIDDLRSHTNIVCDGNPAWTADETSGLLVEEVPF